MSDWRIKALVRGRICGDRSINLQYTDMGTRFWHLSTIYYLTDGDRHVVVDTGYGDPDEVEQQQPLFDLDADRSLRELLEAEAVPPEDVDTLVMSHLHWDHAGNVDIFAEAGADVFVQREAARYAANPLQIHARAFQSPSAGYDPSWTDVDFTYVDGDENIAPGLRAIHTPGHSPGHTSFLVDTGDRTYGLAIDVFPLYENLEGTDGEGLHPPGTTDDEAWWHSANRVRNEADMIVPSHDPDGPANEWVTDG
jgi:glyoxylase-like metal-dependent hydrolase (beta-lactamase superfamily II)